MNDACHRAFGAWYKEFYGFAPPDTIRTRNEYRMWQAAWEHCDSDIAAQNKLASVSELDV